MIAVPIAIVAAAVIFLTVLGLYIYNEWKKSR